MLTRREYILVARNKCGAYGRIHAAYGLHKTSCSHTGKIMLFNILYFFARIVGVTKKYLYVFFEYLFSVTGLADEEEELVLSHLWEDFLYLIHLQDDNLVLKI